MLLYKALGKCRRSIPCQLFLRVGIGSRRNSPSAAVEVVTVAIEHGQYSHDAKARHAVLTLGNCRSNQYNQDRPHRYLIVLHPVYEVSRTGSQIQQGDVECRNTMGRRNKKISRKHNLNKSQLTYPQPRSINNNCYLNQNHPIKILSTTEVHVVSCHDSFGPQNTNMVAYAAWAAAD